MQQQADEGSRDESRETKDNYGTYTQGERGTIRRSQPKFQIIKTQELIIILAPAHYVHSSWITIHRKGIAGLDCHRMRSLLGNSTITSAKLST